MLRKTYVWTVMVAHVISLAGCGQPAGQPASDAMTSGGKYAKRFHIQMAEELHAPAAARFADEGHGPGSGGDKYDLITENAFVPVQQSPLSTFSIDVDTAAYSKMRMFLLQQNALPPADAVRIEELVNYFTYDYSPPVGEHPFSVHIDVAEAPWNTSHRLARIALKGKELDQTRPASNLVFLLDVSGSMDYPNKLPLVKEGLRMLVSQLGESDRVAIVVYAGAAGLVLPSTPGHDKQRIMAALDQLHAGGSTNGGQGIRLAYHAAEQHLIPGGVNRVILCTDGDFNVGTTSTGELVRLAEEHAQRGTQLTVLGFGMGNHNDAMLEQLSNKANGNYAFIDTPLEARKVLCEQINSTLVTIAKDVKIQVEFNPAHVAAYRLIGYENRHLEAHEFNDDRKDAGEIGAGHAVTALYELIPRGEDEGNIPFVDPLKYQQQQPTDAALDELMTVKLRYKDPRETASKLIVAAVKNAPVRFGQASGDFQFAAAVAGFGMLLRKSAHCGDATYASIFETAKAARGEDRHGYRDEFLQLVATAARLSGEDTASMTWQPRETHTQTVMTHGSHLPPPTYHFAGASSSWATECVWLALAACGLLTLFLLASTIIMALLLVRRVPGPPAMEATNYKWPCLEKHSTVVDKTPPVRPRMAGL